jgi:hypothetical protein
MTTRECKLRPAIARPTIFGAAKPIRGRGIDQVNAALDGGVDRQTVPSLQRRAALWSGNPGAGTGYMRCRTISFVAAERRKYSPIREAALRWKVRRCRRQ